MTRRIPNEISSISRKTTPLFLRCMYPDQPSGCRRRKPGAFRGMAPHLVKRGARTRLIMILSQKPDSRISAYRSSFNQSLRSGRDASTPFPQVLRSCFELFSGLDLFSRNAYPRKRTTEAKDAFRLRQIGSIRSDLPGRTQYCDRREKSLRTAENSVKQAFQTCRSNAGLCKTGLPGLACELLFDNQCEQRMSGWEQALPVDAFFI